MLGNDQNPWPKTTNILTHTTHYRSYIFEQKLLSVYPFTCQFTKRMKFVCRTQSKRMSEREIYTVAVWGIELIKPLNTWLHLTLCYTAFKRIMAWKSFIFLIITWNKCHMRKWLPYYDFPFFEFVTLAFGIRCRKWLMYEPTIKRWW